MNLHDPNFLTFAGEPIAGRVPPQLLVDGNDGVLTPAQFGGVTNAYKLFRETLRLSASQGYLVQNRVLEDGTTVRMVSNIGQDQVFVSPPPLGVVDELVFLFFGIPASSTHISGVTELGPSAKWRLTHKPEMPDELTPVGPLSGHPGHTTWSSPEFKIGREEIVLSWRGPRSRYALTSGWSTGTGGSVVAHNNTSTSIGSNVFADSGFIWINGRRINTGISKIISACLHRPDPVDSPGLVVLRVCTDNYPQPSSTRGFAVYDLAIEEDTIGASLKAIVKARSFVIVNTFAATEFQSGAADSGKWDMLQRPHFNKTGEKLATIISLNDVAMSSGIGIGIIGAVFDAETWEILDRINTPTSSSTEQSSSVSGNPSDRPIATIEVDLIRNISTSSLSLIAVDFLDDVVVYVYYESGLTSIETASASFMLDESSVPATTSEGESHSTLDTFSMSVSHSAIGVLHAHEYTVLTESSFSDPGGGDSGSFTKSPAANEKVSFVGDLSKNVFALGWSDEDTRSDLVGSGGLATSGTSVVQMGTETLRGSRLKFDIYFGGELVVSETTGNFNNDAFTSTVTTSPGVVCNHLANFLVADPPSSFSTSSTTDGGGGVTDVPKLFQTTEYQHAAVDARRSVAYLGTSHVVCGLETVIFKTGEDTYEQKSVPAYASGARPTISAPVFIGGRPKSSL